MKKAKKTRLLPCTLVCAALLFAVPCFAFEAAAEDSHTIESFELSHDNWSAGDNVSLVQRYEFPTDEYGVSFRSCLEAVGRYGDVSALRSVTAEFAEPLDLTDYRNLCYDIYVPIYASDPEAVCYTRLTLISGDGSVSETLTEVTGGEWNSVIADIGAWSGRSSIASAEIAYVVDTVVAGNAADHFYIDELRAEGRIDRDMTDRFLFDEFTVDGAEATLSENKDKLTLTAESFVPFSLDATVFLPEFDYDVNCLRLKLANNTANKTMTLRYTTADTQANTEDRTITLELEPNSEAKYYYAYVGDASMLRSIGFELPEGNGSVELHSVSAVDAYHAEEYDVCGKVTLCRLNDDLNSVNFVGEVNREMALANQSARIAIYTYDSDELPDAAELAALTPVVNCEMSTRFELTWKLPANDPYACYRRFIAVITHADGSYSLIAPPFYIDNPERAANNTVSFTADAKGFAADDISLVGDSDSGITVIELDTRRALTSKSEGEQFIYNGCAYYLDSAYLDGIADKVSVLSKANVTVLLRFNGWRRALTGELVEMYSTDSYINYGKMTDAPDGEDFIGAISAYAAKTWCADGSVAGVIFGERENLMFTGEISVSDKIEYTAREMSKIYYNLISVNSEAKVYISVSELYDADIATNAAELALNEYIPHLISESEKYGSFNWEVAVDVAERANSKGEVYLTPDNCGELIALLSDNGARERNLIFCDNTYVTSKERLSALMKRYIIGYYSAFFNDRIDAYIALGGSRAATFAETVKYIDTTESAIITGAALLTLKEDSFADIIEGYDEDKLPKRRLNHSDALYNEPVGIKGAYDYFIFDSVSALDGIAPGYYCGDPQITQSGETAMTVRLDSAIYGGSNTASWMGFSHSFEYPENLEHTPIIAFTVKLDGVTPAELISVPVKLVLLSENERFESIGSVDVGEWVTVYFDIGDFGGIEDTERLQLLVGDSSLASAELLVKDIKGLSREYNDESLESVIADERLKKRSDKDELDSSAYLLIGGAVLIIAATVITVALLSKRRGEPHE